MIVPERRKIRGRVLQQGRPLAGVDVYLHQILAPITIWSPSWLLSRLGPSELSTITDDHGRFEFLLPDRPYCVIARAATTGGVGVADVVPPEAGDAWCSIDLTPSRGVIGGQVRSRTGAEVAGVRVGITRGEGWIRTTRTDAAGRFAFEHVPDGNWEGGVLDRDWHPVFLRESPNVEEGTRLRALVAGADPVHVGVWRESAPR